MLPVVRLTAVIAACYLFTSLLLPSPAGLSGGLVIRKLPHPPMIILSDQDFVLPGSGVTSGSGTLQDPYVIEGWDITPVPFAADNGILIENTTAHLVIRNVDVHGVRTQGGSTGGTGMMLLNVSNVTIEDARIGPSLSYGIWISRSKDVNVTRASIENASSDIVVVRSDRVGIKAVGMTCPDAFSSYGAMLGSEVGNLTMAENEVQCAPGPGISIRNSVNVSLIGNTVKNTAYALDITDTSSLTVRGNVLDYARGVAASLASISGFILEGNRISNSTAGLYVGVNASSRAGGLVKNNMISNTPSFPIWTEGYPDPYAIIWRGNVANGKPVVAFQGVADVTLDGSGIDPALVLVTDATNVRLVNWTIAQLAAHPVEIVNGRNVAVADSHFSRGGGVIIAGGLGNRVSNSRFTAMRQNSIEIFSENTMIENNYIQNNDANGIWIGNRGASRDGTGAVIRGNSVDAAGYPLIAEDVARIDITRNTLGPGPIALLSANATYLRYNNLLGQHLYVGPIEWPGSPMDPVDARENWWGLSTGPKQHERTCCNTTVFDVPWLTEAV